MEEELKTELAQLVEKVSNLKDSSADVEAANNRINELEAKLAKLEVSRKTTSVVTDTEHKAAFSNYIRKGDIEKKYLVEATGNVGGFLVPDDFRNTLYNKIVEFSPIRSVATVLQSSSMNLKVPVESANFSASWTSESGSRTSSTGQLFGQVVVDAHEMYVRVPVSNALLEDSTVDIESWLIDRSAAQFAKLEGNGFVVGNGSGRPEGFAYNSVVTGAALETASESTLAADDIIELFYSLPAEYAANGTWVVNRSILKRIRQMKALTTGEYLWTAGFGTTPQTILGRPVIESPDLSGTVSDGNFVAAFGDFSRGYIVADRIGVEVQRDPYTDADNGNTVFRLRRRVGGEVLLAEAIRLLEVKADVE